ncbi:MAG: hypothetical protein M3Z29_03740 [Pseudomonadota bacterium]|nr:hypothetical protein [Pseudomonadota bacterium]
MTAHPQTTSFHPDPIAPGPEPSSVDRPASDIAEFLSPESMGLRRRFAFDLPPALPSVLLLAAIASLVVSAFLN